MSTTLGDRTAGDEAKWQAWVEKGKRRDRAAALKYRRAGVVLAVLLALVAIYFGVVR